MTRQAAAIYFAFTIACLYRDGQGIMLLNTIGNETTGMSRDFVQRALPSFTITSRPLLFSHENSASVDESGERKTSSGATPTKPWPWQQTPRPTTASSAAHSTKVSLTFLPGKATVVCKGISCSQQGSSFSSSSSSASHFGFYGSDVMDDDDGFAGEAIPIDGGEDFATVVVNEKKPVLLPVTDKPKRPTSGSAPTHTSTVLVHLLTKRPYLNRVRPSTTKKSTTPTVSYIRKRSTTTRVRRRTLRSTSSTTTTTTTKVAPLRRRPVADVPLTTTKRPPQAAPLLRPSGGLSRPSFFFPAAMTAFTLMALPMAAAAVPFLLQVGRKRRSTESDSAMEKIRALHGSHDFETLVQELEKILEKNADGRVDVPVNRTSGEGGSTAVSSISLSSVSESQSAVVNSPEMRPETDVASALAADVFKRPRKRAAI